MKVRDRFTFCKFKLCNKVLVLVTNTTKLGTHGKYNCHKEIKSVIIFYVGENIYM